MLSGAAATSPCQGASSSSSTSPQTSAPQPSLAARQREGRKTAQTTTTTTTPAFLSNLGKATLRGIRKCPRCGVYNGTRGLSCKNKACGIVLRDAAPGGRGSSSKRATVEAVRVVIDGGGRQGHDGGEEEEEQEGGGGAGGDVGGEAQVFSVCQRGRWGATAAQMGFVELVPTDTAIATGDGATLLTRINLGRCFLPACRQGLRSSQGQSSQQCAAGGNAAKQGSSSSSSDSLCAHIKQAMECQRHATPLPLKSSILEGLQVSGQAREELWRLATESPGPLVQRVSRDTLVVKCHTDSNHPLGLLHLTVGAGAGLPPPEGPSSRSEAKGRHGQQQQQAMFLCACQVAEARGRKADAGGENHSGGATMTGSSGFFCVPGAASEPCLHFYACVCAFASDDKLASDFAAFINHGSSNGVPPSAHCRPICAPDTSTLQCEPISSTHHKAKRLRLEEPATGSSGLSVDEHTVTQGFQQWLSSVTERIHQTMHYQFDGKPEALVFHIPQEFFNALQNRLSLGSKKRRLPNTTTAFVRNDGLPLGSFSKYTWHITNLMQVKRIFDTPELPLELTQSFVRNIDGTYSSFRCPEPFPDPEPAEGCRVDRPQAIRPLELRTFLKAGICTTDQKEATPFVIEWIPDILPRSRIGELRIGLEFGHQQSGQPEFCDGATAQRGTDRAGRNKTTSADAMQPKHGTVEIIL